MPPERAGAVFFAASPEIQAARRGRANCRTRNPLKQLRAMHARAIEPTPAPSWRLAKDMPCRAHTEPPPPEPHRPPLPPPGPPGPGLPPPEVDDPPPDEVPPPPREPPGRPPPVAHRDKAVKEPR